CRYAFATTSVFPRPDRGAVRAPRVPAPAQEAGDGSPSSGGGRCRGRTRPRMTGPHSNGSNGLQQHEAVEWPFVVAECHTQRHIGPQTPPAATFASPHGGGAHDLGGARKPDVAPSQMRD